MVRQQIQEVTPAEPCLHCGKPDWCYRLGDLSVCKRDAEPALGWEATSKRDADGSRYYAPQAQKKSTRPAQKRSWDYPARDGSPLIQVRREDYGDGRKAKIRPWRWTGSEWLEGYEGHVDRAEIPVYQLEEVKSAISRGEPIFIVEGEPCADALRSLGLVATTNIGGSKKWRESDSKDLAGAKVILCPDRDLPGLAHMERIAQDFPDASWLYAYPNSPMWNNPPSSQGLDVADWIKDYRLTQKEIQAAVVSKRQISHINIDKSPKQEKQTFTFGSVCERIKEIQQMVDPGEREWEMQSLAKQTSRSVTQLVKAYDMALMNQPAFELTDARELLAKTPDKFDWLVAGLLPMATTALLYAEGGTGKTLLAYSIIKAVACGLSWNGFPTRQGKVLLMQTDEPSIVTAQNLKIAGFQESLPLGQLFVSYSWQFSQMQQLREAISAYQPTLVVIDSLTSSNRTATAEEKDVEYARVLYELRDLAMKEGCAILVLHHENKTGGVRGSTAIKANVSEVWHLERDKQLAPTQRLLDIEKSRAGCSGVFQLQLDVDDLSWQHQGEFDPIQAGGDATSRPTASLPLKARVLAFLEERPGVPFEVEELIGEFGSNRETIRKTLERLWRSGLVQSEQRTKPNNNGKGGQTKYKVYLVADLSQRLEPSQGLDLVAGTTSELSLGQLPCPNDKLPVVPATKPAQGQDCVSLGQTDSGTDAIIDVETVPLLKKGDKVAHKDPAQKSYNWHGVITNVKDDGGCYVRWDERRGMKGGDVLWYRLSDLRLI